MGIISSTVAKSKYRPTREEFAWMEDKATMWLDAEEIREAVFEPTPEEKQLSMMKYRYNQERLAKQRKLILAMKTLRIPQRLFLKALQANNFNPHLAWAQLRREGFAYQRSTCENWMQLVAFKNSMDIAMDMQVDFISKNKVLLDTKAVVEAAMTPRPILFKGIDTGYEEIEGGVALKGLDMLGKYHKLWNEETSNRTILELELVDFNQPALPSAVDIDHDTGALVEQVSPRARAVQAARRYAREVLAREQQAP